MGKGKSKSKAPAPAPDVVLKHRPGEARAVQRAISILQKLYKKKVFGKFEFEMLLDRSKEGEFKTVPDINNAIEMAKHGDFTSRTED